MKPLHATVVLISLAAESFPVPGLALEQRAYASTEETWVLRQRHNVYGDLDVFVGKDAIRVVSLSRDFVFQCGKPDWEMRLYSDKRQVVCRRPYSDWSKKGIKTALSIPNNETLYDWPKVLVTRNKKYRGVMADVYFFPGRLKSGKAASLKFGHFGEYYVTRQLGCQPRVYKFLQSLLDMPPTDGLPLRLERLGKSSSYGFGLKYNLKEEFYTVLDTESVKVVKQTLPMLSTATLSSYRPVLESEIVVNKDEFHNVFEVFFDGKEGAGTSKKKTGSQRP